MRKITLFASAAVLILAGLGGWVASTTHARVEAPIAGGGIDLSQITMNARDLPTEEFVDYSLVFN
jgi:phosphotransferase system  glucose/maltose/N-acetylglucosamine-specific IIC component